MKKTLLSIMAFALSLTAANAQTRALAENQEYLATHGTVTATSGDATKIQGYDETYDFWRSDMAAELMGAKLDLDAVFAIFAKEDLEKYIGYKVVGISVAGEFGQKKVDFMLNINCKQTFGEEEKISSKNVAIAKDVEPTPSVQAMGGIFGMTLCLKLLIPYLQRRKKLLMVILKISRIFMLVSVLRMQMEILFWNILS